MRKTFNGLIFSNCRNHIGGVMVNMLIWSLVDGGFEPRSGQTKDL